MRTAVIILVIMILALVAALILVGPGAPVSGPVNVPRTESVANGAWETSWHAALARASAEQRPVLAFFTGSDWCPPCQQVKREVFSAPAFTAWAQRRVVRLELDYPARLPQPDDLRAQNDALQRHFAIRGYPSTLLISAQGDELGRFESVPSGGVDGYIAAVEKILATPAPAPSTPAR